MKKSDNRRPLVCWILACLLLLLAAVVYYAARQYMAYYDVPFASLLFTLKTSKAGTDLSFLDEMVLEVLPQVGLILLLLFAVARLFLQDKVQMFVLLGGKKQRRICIRTISGWTALALSFPVLGGSVVYAADYIGMTDYLEDINNPTTVYETYYISPDSVSITPPEEKKNLVYIYVESLETGFASKEVGGVQPENYLPNATRLAREFVSFSHSDQLGGFVSVPGTTWTMGATFAIQTALPFAFPMDGNSMGRLSDSFAPSVIGLGDVLEQNGYRQKFLCGANTSFASMDVFFRDHGNFEIYDYATAKAQGDIPRDYHVFWGFEDAKLYEFARRELLEMAGQDGPFHFSMMTVDTHPMDGYICQLCEDTYDHPLANILTCCDRQLGDFVAWIQAQPFYEDTVIVITGDHPRMVNYLLEDLEYSQRTMYNCFINAASTDHLNAQYRQFSCLDIFPTVLGAMGFEIEGDRLGLGTNLFSQRQTLMEELSPEFWSRELARYSEYFVEQFFD